MKSTKQLVLNMIVPFILIAYIIGLVFVLNYYSYDRVQLRSFNKIHNTNIDLDVWRIYGYEITHKYKFTEEIENKKY